MIYYLLQFSYFSTNIATAVEVESIGGNLQAKIILFSLLESVSAFLTGLFILKFNILKLSKISYFINGICFLSFIFAKYNNLKILLVAALIIGKSDIG